MIWLFFALLTVVLATAAALLEKKVLLKEHATEFSVCLALVNVALVIPLAFYVDFYSLNIKQLGFIYTSSLFGTAAFWCLAKALRHMDVSLASPLLATGPALTAALGYFVLGEALSLLSIAGIGVIVLGSIILELQSYRGGGHIEKRCVYLILLAVLLYGFGAIVDRIALSRLGISPLTYIFFIHVFVGANFLILLKLLRHSYHDVGHGFRRFGPALLAIGILTVAYRWTEAQAVSLMAIGIVFAIKRTSTLLVTIIGGRVFHEKHLLWRSVAAAVMILGIWLIV